jgi:hypothetical protein
MGVLLYAPAEPRRDEEHEGRRRKKKEEGRHIVFLFPVPYS